MNRLPACAALLSLLMTADVRGQPAVPSPDIVGAADMFLATLTPEQKRKVVYAFDDTAQRQRWSNFPTGFIPRGGISLKQMSPEQRQAVMRLLEAVLSPMGLKKITQIREADDDFKVNGSRRGPPRGNGPPPGPLPGLPLGPPSGGGPRGPNIGPPRPGADMFGGDLYYISFLGTPSAGSSWMLQFGGHHLALNITISGRASVLAPTLTGAQPASFVLDGKMIRPLGRESDKALAFLRSLNDAQRADAILRYRVADLVLGSGEDGKRIVPEGLKGSALTADQQAQLLDLVSEWTDILNQGAAATRMAQPRGEIADTWFAWSGPVDTEPGNNITAYYRIQSPHLVIEYAPQSDEPGNHVHTMYRDPENDYGMAPTK